MINVVDAHQRVQGMLPHHQIEDNVRTLLCNLVRPLCLHIRSLNAAGVCIGGACYLVARLLV